MLKAVREGLGDTLYIVDESHSLTSGHRKYVCSMAWGEDALCPTKQEAIDLATLLAKAPEMRVLLARVIAEEHIALDLKLDIEDLLSRYR